MGDDEPPRAGAAAVLPGLAGVRCPRGPSRSGRGSVASIISRSVPRANATARRSARVSAPKVNRPPRAPSDLDRVASATKCGTGGSGACSGPACEHLGRVVLAQVERALDQVLAAPRPDDAAERVARAGRRVQRGRRASVPASGDRHRLLARRVGQRVGERDEVEEVVGVQVGEDHRVDVDVVDEAAQLGEHPVAAVEQHADAVRPRRDSREQAPSASCQLTATCRGP